jgi:nicotinamide mononucleotide transporter
MSWVSMLDYCRSNWLEILGMLTCLVSTWLSAKRRISYWPIELVSDISYMIVFFHARLYAGALLILGGFPLSFYGWWYWVRGLRQEGEVRVVRLTLRSMITGIAAGFLGGIVLGVWMNHAHAALPWLDSMLTSYSVLGGWWTVRKHIANWWLWIAVNVVYVGEFISQHLYPTALLYVVLIVLSVFGIIEWQRAARASERAESERQLATCTTLCSDSPAI